MTENSRDYLTDEELEKLIMDVENQGLLCCPSYVRGEVLQRVEVSQQKRKQKFYLYSVKVCVASAAAIFLLFTIPIGQLNTPEALESRRQTSFTNMLSEQTDEMCESLNDFSDMLIFREKQED